MKFVFSLLVACVIACSTAFGQSPTVGLITHTSQSYDSGYVLFAPIASKTTYLIDKCGKEVHTWVSAYTPGLSAYMLPDGSLLRTGTYDSKQGDFTAGGKGGIVEHINWDSRIMWKCVLSNSFECQHHDICPLPNGNFLAIMWEFKSRQEAIKAGRDTSKLKNELWSEKIVEVQPIMPDTYNIVWEWHV